MNLRSWKRPSEAILVKCGRCYLTNLQSFLEDFEHSHLKLRQSLEWCTGKFSDCQIVEADNLFVAVADGAVVPREKLIHFPENRL
jgi:hypothetical protein